MALKNLVKHVREEVKKINSIRPVIKTNLPPPSRNWDIISQKFPYANDWFQKNCIKSVQFIENGDLIGTKYGKNVLKQVENGKIKGGKLLNIKFYPPPLILKSQKKIFL